MINQTIASKAFNLGGLDAMGFASGQLATRWSNTAIQYDQPSMTLTLSDSANWNPVTGGVVIWNGFGVQYLTDATGAVLTGTVGVLIIHPQAALRLRRLIGTRYDSSTDGNAKRPTPFYAALKGGTPSDSQVSARLALAKAGDPPLAPIMTIAGTAIGSGTLSFHDENGLIIDPVAVASLFKDLMLAFPALIKTNGGDLSALTNNSSGSISSVVALATGRRLQLLDLFGVPWKKPATGAGLRFGTGTVIDGGVLDWPDTQALTTTGEISDLRFGFSPQGMLAATALQPPTLPTTGTPAPHLELEFFRVVAVNLNLHLAGNRTADSVEDVDGADEHTIAEVKPHVREGDQLIFLADGQATMGAVNESLQPAGFGLLVSPIITTNGALPPDRNQRWPTFPAATVTAQELNGTNSATARSAVTAKYAEDTPNVVLTWPDNSLPAEAHVKVFQRVDPGTATVPLAQLDFATRGDGASGIVKPGNDFSLLIKDPFKTGISPRSSNPTLQFDLLIVTRDAKGRGRLLGGFRTDVGTGGTTPPDSNPVNSLNNVPLNQRGVSPAPIIGLTPIAPASGTNPVLNALGETAPRDAPRFRTMARTGSIVSNNTGSTPGVWNSVLTAGFLRKESVRGEAHLGNPGNTAGPEDYVPGIKVTGLLGMDLARAALRRTHHLSVRMAELIEDRWKDPTAGTGTFAGAVLQNIADTVESPELALIPDTIIDNLPHNWDGLISSIGSLLPSSLASIISGAPTPAVGERWVEELKRDALAAKKGRRDSQWAWRWALSHAKRLIYIETPLLSTTATGTGAFKVDLLDLIKTQMKVNKNLRVVIATPKRVPFGAGYEAFAQNFYIARNTAIADLTAADPKRVIVYHPIGFPGRPEVIRGTLGIVDDVWALIGSSSLSRRGLTFDGSTDLVFIDKAIDQGISKTIRDIRRQTMGRLLGLAPFVAGETAKANQVRLSDPVKAFELLREILIRGGDGLIEPLWPGVSVSEVLPVDKNLADPDGRDFPSVLARFADILNGLGQQKV